MTPVARLLDTKGHNVYSIGPDASVYEAIKQMADDGVGALLVMEGESLVGIMSERDYTRKIVLQGKSSRETQVRDIMTKDVLYVRPEQTVEDCMALMTAKRVRHLPVLDEDQVIGVLSMRDLVGSVIAEKDHLIQQLENYITGSR